MKNSQRIILCKNDGKIKGIKFDTLDKMIVLIKNMSSETVGMTGIQDLKIKMMIKGDVNMTVIQIMEDYKNGKGSNMCKELAKNKIVTTKGNYTIQIEGNYFKYKDELFEHIEDVFFLNLDKGIIRLNDNNTIPYNQI